MKFFRFLFQLAIFLLVVAAILFLLFRFNVLTRDMIPASVPVPASIEAQLFGDVPEAPAQQPDLDLQPAPPPAPKPSWQPANSPALPLLLPATPNHAYFTWSENSAMTVISTLEQTSSVHHKQLAQKIVQNMSDAKILASEAVKFSDDVMMPLYIMQTPFGFTMQILSDNNVVYSLHGGSRAELQQTWPAFLSFARQHYASHSLSGP